jgi:hypothetical protein
MNELKLNKNLGYMDEHSMNELNGIGIHDKNHYFQASKDCIKEVPQVMNQ